MTPQVHEERCIPEATHRRLSGHASRIVTVLITSSSFWLLADFDGRGKQEEHSFCHSSRSLLFHCIAFRIFNVATTFERTIDFILRGLQWKAWLRWWHYYIFGLVRRTVRTLVSGSWIPRVWGTANNYKEMSLCRSKSKSSRAHREWSRCEPRTR